MSVESDQRPEDILAQLVNQHRVSMAVIAAARLNIADQLVDGPRPAAEIATSLGAREDTLSLLLRVLVGCSLLTEDAQGRFGLTPVGALLASNASDSRRDFVLAHGNTGVPVWNDLAYTIQTGRSAFEHVFGMPFYAYMAQHAETARVWDHSMLETAGNLTRFLLRHYDFAAISTLVDVGGGTGAMLAAVLAAHPRLMGVLFDLPHVAREAQSTFETAGVAARCRLVGGDMFREMPTGADGYLLARVLWNWDDEHAIAILHACQQAMAPGGRVLVLDLLLPDGPLPPIAAQSELNLLLEFGGRLRGESEMRRLLAAAGLETTRVLPNEGRLRIMEAQPAPVPA